MSKLAEIIGEFDDLDFQERLELLLDFSNNLPELPDEYKEQRQAGMNRVPECQTPVFLWVELDDGRVRIVADVAPEAPTVKGFVSILVDAFNGAPPEEVIQAPPDILKRIGLADTLGMVRLRGLNSIVYRIKRQVGEAVAASPELN